MKTYLQIPIAYCVYFLILLNMVYSVASAQEGWMPDPNLRRVVKEKLGVETLTLADMRDLWDIVSFDADVESLQGLEHAVNLRFLHIGGGRISDLTPLVRLKNLHTLKLHHQHISDISPLVEIKSLEVVHLQSNRINDFTPLLELSNLKEVRVSGNPGDLTPLLRLGLDSIKTCDVLRLPITDRIEERSYPSIFGAWHNIINRPSETWNERLVYHDLYFCCPLFGLHWNPPSGTSMIGDVPSARSERDQLLSRNPNMIFLVGIYYYGATPDTYPEDWPYWLRDDKGNLVQDVGWGEHFIDFTHPDAQDFFIHQAVSVAECGLYDGIFLDLWYEDYNILINRETGVPYRSLKAEVDARISILRRIREAVGDDFLILVNSNRNKLPRSAPYINGLFMETLRDIPNGYTYQGLEKIESTLSWAEQHLREPQINCLEGWGVETQPLDSLLNQRWMRVFTALSLTHSDGFVSLVSGIGTTVHQHAYEILPGHDARHARGELHDHQHQHYWYDFWDAELGQPIDEKAKTYRNREGLFIREFTNGWAMYNRSGKSLNIQLPEKVSAVASGVENKRWHTIEDLDGEIYLKPVTRAADVNADGIVNVLDLVIVASAFGKKEPDLTGDGIVNVLDLVRVAAAFGM